ncbi:MAG: response regulator [Planctomycetes bacterium]|nr:response regulator [Planctomycetota bacterium]MBL7038135.1 response regulator [Pirellulaceae bacterium]
MSESKPRSYKAQKVLERMGKKLNRQIAGSMVACVHCGMCTDSCHYVLANPDDPTYAPAYKGDKIRKLFKRHFDWTGRVLPWWVKAGSVFTDEELEELKDTVFGKCTNCRRCSMNCPMGVDLATFNRMARGLLVSVGVMPEGVSVVSKDQWELGNQMGVLKEDYLETLEWMEEELQDDLDDPNIKIPVDETDCEVVYSINPREVKYDPRSIADAAKIFHFAGESWTMPSECWDMTNFGLFSGDDDLGGSVARRLYEKAEDLRGKKLVISECGHGYRSTRCEGPNWGQYDVPFEMESSVLTMLRYVKEGRIKVDKTRNTEPMTFHDSCNNARSCGLTEEPRELLNLVATDFREMYPNRAENYCCTGGGGAMSMSEYTPRRLKSAKIKADQLKATGAKVVVTSCHNCVDGLADLIRHYELDMEVTQLVNLVAKALVVDEKVSVPAEAPVEVAPEKAPALAGRTIVVADDEPDQVLLLSTVFEDHGATVFAATNGDEALELARAHKPDLLTLDLAMPGKEAGEVFEMIRKDPELDHLKVCIVTGRPELRKTIYDRSVAPPEGYLDKPVTEESLMLNVRKVLELSHDDG